MDNTNFIDDLLLEVEEKEKQLELTHVDLILKEICTLNSDIARILAQAEEEKQLIQEWAIKRSAKLNERVEWLSKKCELFMYLQDPSVRTIDLAHGQLLRRKQVEKIVVEDLEQFLLNSNLSELTTTSPEVIKADIAKIKAYYKMTKKIPLGTSLVESSDKFLIKLKNGVINDGTES
jgi:hypothetical protein